MSNYATLKAAIQDVIKTNGNNEITGALLQQSLLSMIGSLGADYQFVGIAEPSTNPGTPDQNVFYIAGAGTYPNFNSAVVPDGHLGALKYNGSWTLQTVLVGKNYDAVIAQLTNIIYGSDIPSYTDQTVISDKYFNTENSRIPAQSMLADATGTSCVYLNVTPGETYRIYGKGDASVHKLYAMGDADRYVVANGTPSGAMNTRATPLDLVIPSGVSILVVNLYQYDAATDKVQKVDYTHQDGILERLSALENEGIPAVIDRLNSTSITDALSANQGRILNEDINGVTTETTEDMPIQDGKYFNTSNSRVPSISNLATTSNGSCVYLNVTPGEVYRIYGRGLASTWELYAMADADRYVVPNGTPGVAMNTRTNGYDLTIPTGVAILVVNLYQYSATTDKVQKIGHVTSECVKTRLNALEENEQQVAGFASPLMGKKIMFFGDSITDITYNGKGLPIYFGEFSRATCYKAAIGGTRFVQRTTPVDTPTTNTQAYAALDICNMVKAWCDADYTKQDAATTFLGEHSARVNAMRNNPIGTVDIVCIGGGTNDMSNSSPIGNDTDSGFTTIKGSINKMIELLLTANPKLKIYFYSPVVGYHGEGGRIDANWDDNHQFSSGLTKPEYIDIFTARTRANHIPYINLYWTLGINQINFSQYYLDTDDHHPYKGLDILARRLYGQILSLME